MFKESVLSNLLRIMTSEEINVLTKDFDGNVRVSLTEIVDQDLIDLGNINLNDKSDLNQKMAKIIPINQKIKLEEQVLKEKSSFLCGVEVKAILEKFKDECLRSEKNIFGEKRKAVKEESNNYESTDFILSQISRTQKNNEKLKKMNVWKLYSQNSSVEIDISKGKNKSKDFSESSTKGILINKKQA